MGILCQDLRRYPLQNCESLLILPLELGIFQLLQNTLMGRLVQGLRELFVFPFEFFILGSGIGEGRTVLFELGPHLLHGRDIAVQQFGNLGGPLLAVQGTDASEQLVQLLALLGQAGHLLEDTRRDMVAARLACALAALQVGVFFDHVLPALVLPPTQLLFVAYVFFGAESPIWRSRDNRNVGMTYA